MYKRQVPISVYLSDFRETIPNGGINVKMIAEDITCLLYTSYTTNIDCDSLVNIVGDMSNEINE